MTYRISIPLMVCSVLLLSACDGGSVDGEGSGLFVVTSETEPTPLDPRQIAILDKIKRRSSDDGAEYEFDELEPVFVQDGDTISVTFGYINPNTVGGSPVVEYSVSQSAITSIVYTQ